MWTERRSGYIHQRDSHDHRDPYERDRTRVIHCPAFRRLQRKTQILGTDLGDFHRTRLTHSLEVSSIGCSIVRHFIRHHKQPALEAILPSEDLMNVICLLHDIGHPPFGHGGEVALNYMMRDHGGFEGNAQTLRLVTKLEKSYGMYGLDLTRRSLLGLLKYPVAWSRVVRTASPIISASSMHGTLRMNDWLPPKAYFDSEESEVDWILQPFQAQDRITFQSLSRDPEQYRHGCATHHMFDCSIMDIADDIAYGVHDLEDAIHLHLIVRSHLDTQEFNALLQDTALKDQKVLDKLFDPMLDVRKQAIGKLVNYFITHMEVVLAQEIFAHPLLAYTIRLTAPARGLLDYLIKCIYKNVIDSQQARTCEYGGQMVVQRLFEALSSNPGALLEQAARVLFFEAQDEQQAYRVVCDYIANMTDDYAYHMYERLFGFNAKKMFDRS